MVYRGFTIYVILKDLIFANKIYTNIVQQP